MMNIDILTTFPQMFESPFSESILKRAQVQGQVLIRIHDLRKWTDDNHKTTDDKPYGGGQGMVMMVEPVDKALKDLHAIKGSPNQKIILTSAKGTMYTQQVAQKFSTLERLVIICGHYEGVDERVAEYLVDEEIRIGNYVLTGGEYASFILVDSVVRLLPNVLGNEKSNIEESHTIPGLLEFPQYTRPEIYNGWTVPKTLLSGNHKEIEKWKREHSTQATTE